MPAEIWKRCEMLFLCSPGNPTGAVLSLEFLRHALKLAEKYDFVIASDECYAELYRDESTPPPSLLQAALRRRQRLIRALHGVPLAVQALERARDCAPDSSPATPALIKPYLAVSHLSRLRHAGAHAAREHRRLERRRPRRRQPRAVSREICARAADPRSRCSTWWSRTARFYLWPDVQRRRRSLHARACSPRRISPSCRAAISRATPRAGNPGRQRVRISLVAPVEECVTAAQRIRTFLAETADQVTDLTTLAATIDEAFERRADINAKNSPPALRHAIEECIELLDSRPGARRREEGRRSGPSTSGSRRPCCCTSARTTTR